jgi:hypothetical protein
MFGSTDKESLFFNNKVRLLILTGLAYLWPVTGASRTQWI